ncbi:hypothetical protein BDB00DRAFT_251414 [Zychaea mexicana]|uniref:uncharacterized protein n=1 Tax=Zychaea mexicana TaxID=64656 RepID=UPI0022FE30B4|nr:uncharacterized protein BDB00DRAFT_251414 [Zychaea mexicana]KAI9470445.1 hypothetical protein BDB00DRAFT_251414 [Zychaea mexicana]
MNHWATLNKGVVVPETDPSEIQIEQFLKLYQQALQYHQNGRLDEAKEIYERIINDDLVESGPETTDPNENLTMTNSSLVMLRFLVYKNYAVLLKHEFDAADAKDIDKGKEAIKYYLMALDIDESEQTLWYRVGQLAYATGNTRLARLAFEHGLYIIAIREKYPDQFDEDDFNENTGSILDFWEELKQILSSGRMSPIQWRCLEGLCEVLVDVGDYQLCRCYMNLASPYYPGWPLLPKLEEKMDISSIENNEEPAEPIHIKLTKVRWVSLLKTLLQRYDELIKTNDDQNPLFNDVPIINRNIYIDVTAREIGQLDESRRDVVYVDADTQMEELPAHNKTTVTTSKQNTAPKSADEDIEGDVSMTDADRTPEDAQQSSSATPTAEKEMQEFGHRKDAVSKTVIYLSQDDDDNGNDNGDDNPSSATSTGVPQNTSMKDDDNTQLKDQGESATPSLKRKRSNLSDEDEEAESESEDKRTTLRASKRQKEKIENEETSRRKMLSEEDEHSESLQEVFDKLANISEIKRHQPWFVPVDLELDESAMSLYWKWFDMKISELSKRYAWDYDNARTGNGMDLTLPLATSSESKRGPQYAIFATTESANRSIQRSSEEAAVVGLINTLNTGNSGVLDSLLQAALSLLEQDIQYDIDPKIADLLVDVIVLLGQDFMEQYLFNESDIVNRTQKEPVVKLTLRICERMVDKLIHMILATLENQLSPRKKSSAVKQAEKVAIQHLTEVCETWIKMLERAMMRELASIFISSPQLQYQDNKLPNVNEVMVRYRYIQGKMAQCRDDVEKAFDWYKCCEELLKTKLPQNTTFNLKCRYDGVLSLGTIRKKLESLELGKDMLSAKARYEKKEYNAIITQLSAAVEKKLEGSQNRSHELGEMLALLAKSYTKVGEFAKAWRCHIRILYYLVYDLIQYGVSQAKDGQFASKDSDTVFFKHLKKIDMCLQEIVNLSLDKSLDCLEAVDTSTLDAVLVVLQMTVQYVFRHADFIPLVNNFTTPTSENHSPSNTTRSARFNSIVINTWVLASTIIQSCIPDDGNASNLEVKHTLTDTLMTLHDELGERQICGVAKGAFLKHLLKLPSNDTKYKMGIYQCYHCLYGVALAGESDIIEEHNVAHEALSQKAAEPLFAIVADSVVERLGRGAQLKSDSKNVVDMVSDLFESLPTDDNNVRLNKKVIESYLSQDVKIGPSVDDTLRHSPLSAVPIDPKRSKISPVYFKIFWIGGRTIRLQIKNRSKFNAEKTAEDLENAIELFTNHIILDPHDVSGWAELGHCYAGLADEELIWSAINVKTHRDLIATYQKKAFHAFRRALHLIASNGSSQELNSASMFDLYSRFGFLLYGMVCPPMKGASLETKVTRRIMTADKQFVNVSQSPSDPKNAYKMALKMFHHALRFKSSEKWRCYQMIGSCCKKLGRPAKEVLQWFLEAVVKLPPQTGSDRIFEPVYKLYSALAKYLYRREVQPNDVGIYLETQIAEKTATQEDNNTDQGQQHQSGESSAMAVTEGDRRIVPTLSNPPIGATSTQQTQKDPYDIILSKLAAIRRVDKHKWHHRPIYRSAWILYHVYNQTENAKNEILELFSLRSNSKSFTSMWKTNYERPGKFFEYVHQCTMLLIELAKETRDIERLKLLKEKLHKASSTVLLYTEELISAVDDALKEATADPVASQQQPIERHRHDDDDMNRGEAKQSNNSNDGTTSGDHYHDVIIL